MPKIIQVGDKRKISYQKLPQKLDIPNLIDVQLGSYYWFLQPECASDKRRRQGLHEVFLEVFPIQDFSGNLVFLKKTQGFP